MWWLLSRAHGSPRNDCRSDRCIVWLSLTSASLTHCPSLTSASSWWILGQIPKDFPSPAPGAGPAACSSGGAFPPHLPPCWHRWGSVLASEFPQDEPLGAAFGSPQSHCGSRLLSALSLDLDSHGGLGRTHFHPASSHLGGFWFGFFQNSLLSAQGSWERCPGFHGKAGESRGAALGSTGMCREGWSGKGWRAQ